jgi:hypothetical protein
MPSYLPAPNSPPDAPVSAGFIAVSALSAEEARGLVEADMDHQALRRAMRGQKNA